MSCVLLRVRDPPHARRGKARTPANAPFSWRGVSDVVFTVRQPGGSGDPSFVWCLRALSLPRRASRAHHTTQRGHRPALVTEVLEELVEVVRACVGGSPTRVTSDAGPCRGCPWSRSSAPPWPRSRPRAGTSACCPGSRARRRSGAWVLRVVCGVCVCVAPRRASTEILSLSSLFLDERRV